MAPPTIPIKIGFVGLSSSGWASDVIAPALTQQALKGTYDIVAISNSSDATSASAAEKYGKIVGHPISAYSGNTAKIASDPNVDLVAVSVKTPMHKELVMPVIEAKKDFFIEWPAGRSLQETLEIAEAAKRNGVRSLIGLQGHDSAIVTKIKEIIASGKIGTVLSTNVIGTVPQEFGGWGPVTIENNSYVIEAENGATMLSIIIGHFLNLFTQTLGDFASVSATSTLIYDTTTIVDKATKQPTGKTLVATEPDHISFSGVLKSKAFVNAMWRTGYKMTPGRRHFLWEIDGEEGTIRVESDLLMGAAIHVVDADLYINGEKVEYREPGAVGGAIDNVANSWKEFAKGELGRHPTIDDAVKNHRLLAAIRKSFEEDGKSVRFE
ncbi:unnamed protein product [Cyclocybe aegerita]|uniref:Gfo/Idh/MocA-like oxidoreductase N-terminal domain-containing protein n=1 Tax=Cyclocybe aegerita TaxID=1973307 RepID=A0A8S0W9E7_CYCAE|nr:unnamed protein product [Cyclocybe aegerita]